MNTNEAIWLEWFSHEKKESILKRMETTYDILCRNKLLLKVLTEIIKEELSEEVNTSELSVEVTEREKQSWLESIGIKKADQTKENIEKRLSMLYINDNKMKQQYTIEAKIQIWAKQQWKNDVPTMYLGKKNKFDTATYRIIRFDLEKYKLGNEIYHRIKNNEITFKEACMIHGTQQDKLSRGRPLTQTMNEVNPSIRERLRNMKPGQLSVPFKIPDWIIMTELLDLKTSSLNESIKEILIRERLVSFLRFGAVKVAAEMQKTASYS